MLGSYDTVEAEGVVSSLWHKHEKKVLDGAHAFTVIMPPPNVTGDLHIGHALNLFLQDTLVRNRIMHGDNVLWQPGKDHAGIATQLLVERHLRKNNIDPRSLSAQELKNHAHAWCEKYSSNIDGQMRRLGLACNWSRNRFTLDEQSSRLVTRIFVKLHQAGLIYRDYRLVNWDCDLQTAISDLEVEPREQPGTLWYIKYPLADNAEAFITVATTRPETLLGDTAVAVNPKDKRYKKFIGKQVRLPLTDRTVPVISDDHVKMDYGSGALKITPGHDFNDFEVGQRHQLKQINILHEDGTLNDQVPMTYRGLSWKEARKAVLNDLTKEGLLLKEESIMHTVPYGDRSGTLIQPRLTKQWMMNCKELAQKAIKVVKDRKIKFLPSRWSKIYMDWLSDIQPWCLSRQLWWGHRIPAWYGEEGTVFVAESLSDAQTQARKHYGRNQVVLTEDPDVLDTWFSSGLWPFSTLDWGTDDDLTTRRYPTNILVTSFDIIFFWVARMVMLSLFATEEVPFREVYIHALVRDEKGQKMSKSKGNVIDPLKMVTEYGSDALRLALLSMAVPGQDICMSESRVAGYGHFVHKVWNMAKFIHSNTPDDPYASKEKDSVPKFPDVRMRLNVWMLNLFDEYMAKINKHYNSRNFSAVVNESYGFVWNQVCDQYLEYAKSYLREGSLAEQREVGKFMKWFLSQLLIILHPIMPHVTEYIWQQLELPGLLLHQSWSTNKGYITTRPNYSENPNDLGQFIHEVRSIRSILGIHHYEPAYIYVMKEYRQWLNDYWIVLKNLLNLKDLIFYGKVDSYSQDELKFPTHVLLATAGVEVCILFKCCKEELLQNIQKKIDKAEKELNAKRMRLKNFDPDKFPIEERKKFIQDMQEKECQVIKYKSIEKNLTDPSTLILV